MTVNKIINNTIDTFFPKFCFSCQKEGSYLCQDCRHLLEILDHDYCLCEKYPVRIFDNQKNGKCSRCQNKLLSGLYFALNYKNNHLIEKLIKRFKYKPYIKELSKDLANIIAEHLILSGNNTNDIWENSILVPVPIYIKKQKDRGYNQSEEIARELSKIIKVPICSDVLIKIKETPSQAELKKEQRIKNLENTFTIYNPQKIKNKKIFLIDDIYTTGSTMQECARILKTAKVKQIWGITIAREEYT